MRATFQGTSAAWGKVGAIIADVVFGYVSQRTTFYLSAAFGIAGAIATVIFLPDTTELSIAELDRMAKFMLADEFHHYHGEAINPKFLSMYERQVRRAGAWLASVLLCAACIAFAGWMWLMQDLVLSRQSLNV